MYLHFGRHPFQLSGLWRLGTILGLRRKKQGVGQLIFFKLRLPCNTRHTSLFLSSRCMYAKIPVPVRTGFVSGERGGCDGYETACIVVWIHRRNNPLRARRKRRHPRYIQIRERETGSITVASSEWQERAGFFILYFLLFIIFCFKLLYPAKGLKSVKWD